MVCIPSAITPILRKKLLTAHMIQPVIAFKRSVSAVAAATIPTVAEPFIHIITAQPTTPTISNPFRNTKARSIIV